MVNKAIVTIIAVLVILWGVMCILFQIQTTEAAVLGNANVTFHPDFTIIRQPFDLLGGKLSGDVAIAVLVGWGVEFIYLMAVYAYEHAHYGVHSHNQHIAPLFLLVIVAVAVLNFITDLLYGQLGSGVVGHVIFAIVVAFFVAFAPVAGGSIIEKTWFSRTSFGGGGGAKP